MTEKGDHRETSLLHRNTRSQCGAGVVGSGADFVAELTLLEIASRVLLRFDPADDLVAVGEIHDDVGRLARGEPVAVQAGALGGGQLDVDAVLDGVTVLPRGGAIEGMVRDVNGPLADIHVHCQRQDVPSLRTFTVTAADGTYGASFLPGGAYTVVVDETVIPAGLVPSYNLDLTVDHEWSGVLGEAASNLDVDFGYTGTGTIGDTLWYDSDGDGVQDRRRVDGNVGAA